MADASAAFASRWRWPGVCLHPTQEYPMALILSTLYWDKKVKIAVLTFATFAALC